MNSSCIKNFITISTVTILIIKISSSDIYLSPQNLSTHSEHESAIRKYTCVIVETTDIHQDNNNDPVSLRLKLINIKVNF